jgi:hypothetical protein
MRLSELPAVATWQHTGVRTGYEVLFVQTSPAGVRLRGVTTAVEEHAAWSVSYRIDLDDRWRTRRAEVVTATADAERRVAIHRSDDDRWTVNGVPQPALDGCVDVDLESSSVTNTLPVHRLPFARGAPVSVPAAFVWANDLRVQREEQTYTLTGATAEDISFHYESPTFDFRCELTFDAAGLILHYPGLARRHR